MIQLRKIATAVYSAIACMHAAVAGVVTVNVVTNGGSAVDTVVVFEPLDTTPPPAGHDTAVIDQVHKTFKPRVTVVRAGTVVSFPNSDNIHHEVYSFSPNNPFKLALYGNEPHITEQFDKPGVNLLGCNIHDSMLAFVVVVNSPYFAVVPESGRVQVTLPPGHYRARAWNEKWIATATAKAPPLAVGDGPSSLSVDLDRPRENPETWTE